MADLDKVLRFVVTDAETKQTIAAFNNEQYAELWADWYETRTGRVTSGYERKKA
jgi:hypothetical protein